MFSNKSKDSPAPAGAPAAAPAPVKRHGRAAAAPSIISADLVVVGTLTSAGDIQIDGRVEGDVRSAGLVIGEKAQIDGEILADDVTVRGHVRGRIRARKVLLCATSRVEGDIMHEAFAVEAGAFFEGNCRHADNPLGEDGDAKPAAPVEPASAKAPLASGVSPMRAPYAVAAPLGGN
jgi:cytoskeletal protein CcmA (bactofilin family)